jgi:hypothetical protein
VLDNSGDRAYLERQIDAIWPELENKAAEAATEEARKAAEKQSEEPPEKT